MKTCKDISELLSESMYCPLTWRERLALCVHFSIYSSCSGFQNNLQFCTKRQGVITRTETKRSTDENRGNGTLAK